MADPGEDTPEIPPLLLRDAFPPVPTAEWHALARADVRGADYERRLAWRVDEGVVVKPFYRSEDLIGLEHLIDVVELVALPPLVGRGVRPQVDGDVEDLPPVAADELGLAALHVDAAQDPCVGATLVVLDEVDLDAEVVHLAVAERLHEEAALVAVDGRLDQDDALDLRRQAAEVHWPAPSVLPYWRS